MQKRLPRPADFRQRFTFGGQAAGVGFAFLLLLCLALGGCKHRPAKRDVVAEKEKLQRARVVTAAWYDVPENSRARRRAGSNEFTAAQNKLPLGTLVRVTRLLNGKTVEVRITDRGIHDRSVQIDLCREAATELGMLSDGLARVRMEVIDEDPADSPTP